MSRIHGTEYIKRKSTYVRPPEMERLCKGCGKKFTPRRKNQTHCAQDCYQNLGYYYVVRNALTNELHRYTGFSWDKALYSASHVRHWKLVDCRRHTCNGQPAMTGPMGWFCCKSCGTYYYGKEDACSNPCFFHYYEGRALPNKEIVMEEGTRYIVVQNVVIQERIGYTRLLVNGFVTMDPSHIRTQALLAVGWIRGLNG